MEEIIEYFGNKAELARMLAVDRSAVTQWGIDGLPPGRAIEIEKLSRGYFKAVEIVGLKNEKQK